MKHRLKTDRHGVNVWPYASRMLDESRIKDPVAYCSIHGRPVGYYLARVSRFRVHHLARYATKDDMKNIHGLKHGPS